MVVKKNILRSIIKNVSCCTDEEKIHMLGLPNVTNTIQKVQGSPIVFTTIEKDKKIFHQSSIHIYFSDNDMSLLYWLTYLYIVCIL